LNQTSEGEEDLEKMNDKKKKKKKKRRKKSQLRSWRFWKLLFPDCHENL
jgi:hypothetical protein